MWFCVVNSTPPRFLMQPKFCIISLQTFCTSFRCTALTATSSFRSSASFFSARAALATASSSVFCCSLQIKIVDHNDEWLPINWIAHHTHSVYWQWPMTWHWNSNWPVFTDELTMPPEIPNLPHVTRLPLDRPKCTCSFTWNWSCMLLIDTSRFNDAFLTFFNIGLSR